MLCEPRLMEIQREYDEWNDIPTSRPYPAFTTHRCGKCGVDVDNMTTANPSMSVCVVDKGTMTPHWRKCPKQQWRWRLQNPFLWDPK